MGVKTKYFCDGPQGNFVTTDLSLARALVDAFDKHNDWTITDIGTTTPECWAVYAKIGDKWFIQYPVRSTKKAAEEDASEFPKDEMLEIRPLCQEII